MFTRTEVSQFLYQLFYADSRIIAVWEAGSAATGYVDDVSDLDLAIVCEDDAVEHVFEVLGQALEQQYGILSSFRVPEPAWHGFSQTFYRIKNVPPLFYLDIAVLKQSLPKKMTEVDRHGIAKVWFEKKPMYEQTWTSPEEHQTRLINTLKQARSLEFVLRNEWLKALHRGNVIESYTTGLAYLQRIAAPFWNAKYRPSKVDFGLRYSERDYPNDVVQLIQSYLLSSSIEQLRENAQRILAVVDELRETK